MSLVKDTHIELTGNEKAALKKVKPRRAIDTVYIINKGGIDFMIGIDAEETIDKIEGPDMDPSYYRFYDEDRHKWAYIAVKNEHGNLEPLTFPEPEKYGTTSSELYVMTVTFSNVLAHAIEIIRKATPTFWERIMKPTTVITAIVVIVFILFIMAVGMTG